MNTNFELLTTPLFQKDLITLPKVELKKLPLAAKKIKINLSLNK